jgi:hypothetical protein
MHVRYEGTELSPFRTFSEWVVFVVSHKSEQDFDAITLLFSVAPLSRMQLKNSGVMLPKFYSNSLFVTNLSFVGHS